MLPADGGCRGEREKGGGADAAELRRVAALRGEVQLEDAHDLCELLLQQEIVVHRLARGVEACALQPRVVERLPDGARGAAVEALVEQDLEMALRERERREIAKRELR